MRLVDYKCSECQRIIEDVSYTNIRDIKEEITCGCGGTAVKIFGMPRIYIDDWTPRTMDARRDIEHFEKLVFNKNGKRVARRARYAEDQAKQGIPQNISEV